MTMENLMSQLEPITQAFIDGLVGAKPLYTLSPEAARDVLVGVQKSVSVTLAPARSEDLVLNVGPKGRTNIRIYRPENAKGVLPAVIYTHGGGWVLGDRETHDRLVRELTVGANAVVVFVDYDRSPESRYPVAVEESYAVLNYVAEHPGEFRADASRIAIAGDSVGGNMTAVVALLAKERNGPEVKAQLLFYPVTDASMSTGSYKEFAERPLADQKGDGMVLGSISARGFQALRHSRLADQRQLGATQGPAPNAALGRRE
jgi:acetyl esterase